MNSFNEHYRFGSARWASKKEIRNASLFFSSVGPAVGFFNGKELSVPGCESMITIAGAGAGKGRDIILANLVCRKKRHAVHFRLPRVLVHDPRGELAAVTMQGHAFAKRHVYCLNPYRLHGLPAHKINPWDMLRPDSPSLLADIKLLIADLIPLSGSANGEYFELRARQWCEALVLFHVLKFGHITMPVLYELVNAVLNPNEWPEIAELMLSSPSGDVRNAAIDIQAKRETAPKEFSAYMGEILKSLGFLTDPAIYEMLSGSDFSLEVLCQQDCTVFNIIPAEYMEQLAPMNRAIVGAAMLYKYRNPDAPQVFFLIDEAATFGRFESLLRAYTYARGMGIRAWTFWQNIDQIVRNFGKDAVPTFMGSSAVRQFFGVRDFSTAQLVSNMLGTQTLEFDDVLAQGKAVLDRKQAARQVLAGGDPFEAAWNIQHQKLAAKHRTKQARALMTPDEIMNMAADRQILFVSGIHPIFAHKKAYYDRCDLAGSYLPNPYHKPTDKVRIATRFGKRWRRVITEPVPEKFGHLPQYQGGEWSFIQGYRPD